MKIPLPRHIALHGRFGRSLTVVGVLLLVGLLVAWTVWFLRRETVRGRLPARLDVEIPVLDRALLSEFAARAPR